MSAAIGADTGIDEYRAAAWRKRYRHLERLCDELRLAGITSELSDDPYLKIFLPHTAGDMVYIKPHDGEDVYCWTSLEATHPVEDPAGAARRIAIQLRREQRLSW